MNLPYQTEKLHKQNNINSFYAYYFNMARVGDHFYFIGVLFCFFNLLLT